MEGPTAWEPDHRYSDCGKRFTEEAGRGEKDQKVYKKGRALIKTGRRGEEGEESLKRRGNSNAVNRRKTAGRRERVAA